MGIKPDNDAPGPDRSCKFNISADTVDTDINVRLSSGQIPRPILAPRRRRFPANLSG
jgi:hypothetical protein